VIHRHQDDEAEVNRFEHVQAFVPEGAVPIASVAVVEYLDTDGNTRFGIEHHGDVPLSTFVGLMELAKVDMVESAKQDWDEGE
jgi:hypothetical protein